VLRTEAVIIASAGSGEPLGSLFAAPLTIPTRRS